MCLQSMTKADFKDIMAVDKKVLDGRLPQKPCIYTLIPFQQGGKCACRA